MVQYVDELGHEIDSAEFSEVMEDKLGLLRALANMCQMHPAVKVPGGEEWHDKAAV